MKAILFLGLLSVVMSSPVFSVETLDTIKDVKLFFENAESVMDIFSGIGNGIVQTAKNDVKAFPECIYGFPCAYEVILEFIAYIKEMKKFDIVDLINKLKALLLQGLFGCLQPCFIPYTYIARYAELFKKGTILEKIKNFFIQGLLLNLSEIILGVKNIIAAFTNKDFYECGYSIGVILWSVIIR
jgi:hypothetical protein